MKGLIVIKRDYHLHPNLLKKPEQADLFIERAIELGFGEICFTDHMPYSVTGDEHDRIPFGMVGEYCKKVREKAAEYKDKIIIRTGIEIDYHPQSISEIETVLDSGDFDYVLGSSHLNIKGYGIKMNKTTRAEFAKMVLENYLSAVNSGYFDVLSHLDVYRWVFSEFTLADDDYSYKSNIGLINKIFSALEKTGVKLEINAAALYKGFDKLGPYPETELIKLSKNYNIGYIYGSDAHTFDKLGYGYDKCMELIK